MSLVPGTRLGPYEVITQIGAGGMGDVYRATDTNLKRAVALKVLPASVAADAERLARFQREAEVLASLNHPNIAAIYGLERSGGTPALVMELVEGPTLMDRIAGAPGGPEGPPLRTDGRRGGSSDPPIPIEEALSIARQIADALEAAHECGIIHRDLKPANVKVRPDGTVKVLDFGLAKAMEPAGSSPDASQSPTITSPALMTGAGVILGTAAYMSPEQARGKTVDKRADIWAFGCVLYEMLAGQRAFEDEDVSMTLSKVLLREPDFDALPPSVPARVRQALRVCLRKDPKQRVADIRDVRLALEGAFETAAPQAAAPAVVGAGFSRPGWRRVAMQAAGALVVAVVAGAAVWLAMRPAPPPVIRTEITTAGATALSMQGADRDLAITPDGSRIVYRGNNQLLVRAFDQIEPSVLSGLGEPRGVFVSPDGQWVGFFEQLSVMLKKVAITGGPPLSITRTDAGAPRGATWSEDGTIIFATAALATGLQRVSAAGGEPTVLTKPDRERGELDHVWPEFLPGGEAVLFTIAPISPAGGFQIENAQIAVLDLESGTSKVLIRGGSHAHYVPTGHLVYGVAGTLRATAFDLGRLEVVGTPAPVLEGVVTTNQGAADVAVAANGSLIYVPGGAGRDEHRTVVSVDREGRASPLPGLPLDSYGDVRVSPDGARLALATQTDVWTYDFVRATRSRLTTDPGSDTHPLWTPDWQRIVFTSRRAGYPELFWRPADGTGRDERLLARAKDLVDLQATGWSADGRQLLFTEVPPNLQEAIGEIAIERPSDARMLVKSEFSNDFAAVSPDGRWMAYRSNVSGRQEIYVERYPELGNRQQLSTDGGRIPLWSRDGRELFFSSQDGRQMFAVPVQSGTTLVAGRPRVLFEFELFAPGIGNRPYDLAPDGRFLIIRSGEAEAGRGTASNLILVQNWHEELKRLVPVR
jgi:hypothetical protein